MIKQILNQSLGWWVVLSLVLTSVVASSAEEYEVDGEIMQTLFKSDGSVQEVTRSKFTVFVKDCSWLIQTTDHDESGMPLIVRETACTNGSEIYEMQRRIDHENTVGAPGGVRSLSVATIVSNNVPIGQMDDYFVCHLWEMFASKCFFQKISTNWITPVYDLNASVSVDPKLTREAKWQLISGSGSLPLSVVYLETSGRPKVAGRTNAIYMATGVTNAGVTQIPSGFVFLAGYGLRFGPGAMLSGASPATYHFSKQAIATVSAVREGCSRSELVPTTDGKTIVIDQRLPPVAVPTGTTIFSEDEMQSLSGMVIRLRGHSDKVSAFLWHELANADQVMLTNSQSLGTMGKQVQGVVLEALNKIVAGPCIFEPERFKGISLRPETTNLLNQKRSGDKLAHLNRLLLEDAFPVELSPRTHPSAYVVQDGVDWLPVEKAKQIYISPPVPPQKPTQRATVVFYILMVSVSAVFLFFLSRLKRRGI